MSIDVNYYSFSPSRADTYWDTFTVNDIIALRINNQGDIEQLSEEQIRIRNSGVDYLIYEKTFDSKKALHDLKTLDLLFGAVKNQSFENPKIETMYLEAIMHAGVKQGVVEPIRQSMLPTRDEWVSLHESAEPRLLREAAQFLFREGDFLDQWMIELKQYLRSLDPIVKDFQEHPDAIFIRWYGGQNEVQPSHAETLMAERATSRLNKLRGSIPPVL